jgi:hypothetical protein
MQRHSFVLPALCAISLLAAVSWAQHGGSGAKRFSGIDHGRRPGFTSGRITSITPLRPVPITRPVDLVWPPVIIEPPGYALADVPYAAGVAHEEEQPVAEDRGVEVRLDDCTENAGKAGYNFLSRSVVSCEDSTVDIYLSFTEDGHYLFLVPEDTQIKDVGPRDDIRSIRLIKPANWSPDHGTEVTAGHVYVVWAYSGDLYLVKVDALWEKHVLFSWLWHSHLSREAAEKFLKEHAGGPPEIPYFPR